ncbi:DEAD-box ATP-dependent RNA helicase [Chloropicon primus]|uniref:ATP-dependent RNA helicase n=1 Tax=Chloropicon primus TaxID=1764295 RepID=A0A5B8MF89_9CHLO|nr:DEAD-box ATP-dependent RNA helicase [Chloropicon primus]|eukprot:QDZ18012.1 DEAD-box ATP-dependent RNA helicase [Chloropicon primus]
MGKEGGAKGAGGGDGGKKDHQGTRLFSDFEEISTETAEVLAKDGFTRASPVQEATIPLLLSHKDVTVEACTGSGKTFAFIVPVVEILRKLHRGRHQQHKEGGGEKARRRGNKIIALVVSPTRELAGQIYKVAKPLVESVGQGAGAELVVGGSSNAEEDAARIEASRAEVLIGTPGRLYDLICICGKVDMKQLEILVLDEADRILDEGFKQQISSILGSLPKQRRTGLFSATQTEEVKQLARAGLRNPFRVVVRQQFRAAGRGQGKPSTSSSAKDKIPCAEVRVPSQLSLQYAVCSPKEKLAMLVKYIRDFKGEKGIVYLLTCACVEFCAKALKGCGLLGGHNIWPLHGRMKQGARNAALKSFTESKSGVLLCTDVAARGLDIPSVQWIVQLDPPQDPSFFIHRVGRTARMGQSGRAILFLHSNEETYVPFLQKRKVPISEKVNLKCCEEDLSGIIRKMNERDRDMLDKSIRAFVTYIRAYTEHQCQYIFRLKELDVGHLGNFFALLRLPKMKEIKKIPGALLENFQPSQVDPAGVPYLDKSREKQRQEKLEREAEAQAKAKIEREEEKKRRQKIHQNEKRLPSAKRHKIDALQDDLELEEDWKLFKKLKKGKITEEEYDVQVKESREDIQKQMDKKRKKKRKNKRGSREA